MHIADASSIAIRWVRSSHSAGNNDCVEIGGLADLVAVRDSKHPAGPALLFTPEAMRAFVADVVTGTYDVA